MEPSLEFAFETTLTLKRPRLEMKDIPVGGNRLSVQIEGGYFEGPLLKGTVMPGGGEWPHVRTDDVFCFDARYHLRVDDGTMIMIENRGYRHASPEVMERLWNLKDADSVAPSEYYLRAATTFTTAPGKHDWLSRYVFIGVGERTDSGNKIRYYKVM